MRDILFKAKQIDTGEWVEGDLIHYESGEVAILEQPFSKYGYEATEISGRTMVDPNTICQYTGLTDKNGNKIWENDVVRYKGEYEEIFKIQYYSSMCRFVLVKNGAWKGIEMDWGKVLKCSTVEVIGNIFDNPELLKEDSQ